LHGGRFNRVGVPALYVSLRFETAWLEAQQALPFKAQPMTLCGYQVDCEDIADLSDAATLAALEVDRNMLACSWEYLAARGETPPSWALADRLIAGGQAGIVTPSFAPGALPADLNAVFWRWAPTHRIRSKSSTMRAVFPRTMLPGVERRPHTQAGRNRQAWKTTVASAPAFAFEPSENSIAPT
jgi:RES domain-containing protein